MSTIQISDFVHKAQDAIIVDVRSPGEFVNGHIPGAINIPLFQDNERAEIGTLYKQVSRMAAIDRGLEIVGPKIAGFVHEVRSRQTGAPIIVHCWRGGMRSGSFAWLLNTADIEVNTLAGGYKSFRSHIYQFWELPMNLKVISGCTGSGKTELLQYLKSKGEQVVDLEGLASHKGSAFGGMGQPSQPTSEQFQNNLFWTMKDMDFTKPIWLEDESINIGQVCLPDKFWFKMLDSELFVMQLNRKVRVKRLVSEYGMFSTEKLQGAIHRISKKLGGLRTQEALRHLEERNLTAVVEDVLDYYDTTYLRNIEKRKEKVVWEKAYEALDLERIYLDLIHSVSGG